MDSTINSSKLDEKVKKTLSNYEAPYDPTDWAQMESMLDVAPNHSALTRSNSPAMLIGLVVVGVIILLYVVFKPSKVSENSVAPVMEMKQPEKEIIKEKPAVVTKSVVVKPDTSSIKKVVKEIPKKDSITPKKEVTVAKSTKENPKVIEKKVVSKLTNTTTVNSIKKVDQPVLVKKEMSQAEKSEAFLRIERAEKKEAQLKKEKAAKKEAQLKKEKSLKKEVKTETKPAANDTVNLDDENDSNKVGGALKGSNESNLVTKTDTAKVKEVSKSKKETRSKKDKKASKKDTATVKTVPEEIKKDTLKAPK